MIELKRPLRRRTNKDLKDYLDYMIEVDGQGFVWEVAVSRPDKENCREIFSDVLQPLITKLAKQGFIATVIEDVLPPPWGQIALGLRVKVLENHPFSEYEDKINEIIVQELSLINVTRPSLPKIIPVPKVNTVFFAENNKKVNCCETFINTVASWFGYKP